MPGKSVARRVLLIGVPLLALMLVLALAGVFREAAPSQRAATAAALQPPGPLVTAADYLAQGDFEFDRNRPAAALAAYTQALALQPDYAEAYNNRAYVKMSQQDYEGALSDLNRALALRPDYVNALLNRGDIYNYYYQVDRARAIEDYNRILALDPEHVLAYGHRAMAELHLGDMGGFFGDTTAAIRSRWHGDQPVQ